MSYEDVAKESASRADSKEQSDSEMDVKEEFKSTDIKTQFEQLKEEYGINHTKLMTKIDICVVPPFCFLYFLSFLDRVNISNANLYNLLEDLHLKGNQYNTALTLFFVPYVFFEILTNYAIKFVRPHIWLSVCILIFGVISIGMGFVTNFAGLAACRFLVGMAEASTFPSLFYLLSTYYTKEEAQRRFSAFFSVTCLAGAASGAMAYRINDLDGRYGIASWSWVFIIEGAITAGGAIILFFTIADFPEESRFLKQNEKDFLKRKLELYAGANSGYEMVNKLSDVARAFKDYLIWLPALAYFGLIIPSYGYAYFSATIIKQMGYTAVSANQHSIYPWLAAFGLSNILSFMSDKTRHRFGFFLFCCLVSIIGLALILAERFNPKARYAGCFLAASGLYTAMPLFVCWTSLNFHGHLRKSVGTAFQIGFGNIGGIIATFIFLQKDAPVYKPGLSVSLAAVAFAILIGSIYLFSVVRRNKTKQQTSYIENFESKSERDQTLAGDLNPNFTYLY